MKLMTSAGLRKMALINSTMPEMNEADEQIMSFFALAYEWIMDGIYSNGDEPADYERDHLRSKLN